MHPEQRNNKVHKERKVNRNNSNYAKWLFKERLLVLTDVDCTISDGRLFHKVRELGKYEYKTERYGYIERYYIKYEYSEYGKDGCVAIALYLHIVAGSSRFTGKTG